MNISYQAQQSKQNFSSKLQDNENDDVEYPIQKFSHPNDFAQGGTPAERFKKFIDRKTNLSSAGSAILT